MSKRKTKTPTPTPTQLTLQKFLKLHDVAVEQKSLRRALRNKFRNTDVHEHNTRWQFNVGSDVHNFLCERFNVSKSKTH